MCVIIHIKQFIIVNMTLCISRSPDRFSFQKNLMQDSDNSTELTNMLINEHLHKFDTAESRKHNLEYDLLTTTWILEKVRSFEWYAQNLYAAICNNDFIKREPWPLLKDQYWSCSWRYAGGIIADMRQEGDYIDWYCSGIRDFDPPSEEEWNSWTQDQQVAWTNNYSKYVSESTVTDEIEQDLYNLGWLVVKHTN